MKSVNDARAHAYTRKKKRNSRNIQIDKYKSREFITYSRRDRARACVHQHILFDKIKSSIFGEKERENEKKRAANDHIC